MLLLFGQASDVVMEKELDEEFASEFLKDPENSTLINLVDQILENVNVEYYHNMWLNVEKCRVYIDCLKGYFLLERIVAVQDKDILLFEEYKFMLFTTVSELFKDSSMDRLRVKHRQGVSCPNPTTLSLSFEVNLYNVIILSSRLFEFCDGEDDKSMLCTNYLECILILADLVDVLHTVSFDACMDKFVDVHRAIAEINCKQHLDVFAQRYHHCRFIRGN